MPQAVYLVKVNRQHIDLFGNVSSLVFAILCLDKKKCKQKGTQILHKALIILCGGNPKTGTLNLQQYNTVSAILYFCIFFLEKCGQVI